jgi:GTP-binding protein
MLEAEFLYGATAWDQIPANSKPEIAFIGRSNVGKSSLINSLVARKKLAFVSRTPGKTREINFFSVNGYGIFVDLPGFGFASVSKSLREQFVSLNYQYLEQRKELSLVCVLVDSRHDPQKLDMEVMERLENAQKKFCVVLTKTDKITQIAAEERKHQIKELMKYCQYFIDVVLYSVEKPVGKYELLGLIKKYSKERSIEK